MHPPVALYTLFLGLGALFSAIGCWIAVIPCVIICVSLIFYARKGHYLGVRRPPATRRGLWLEQPQSR